MKPYIDEHIDENTWIRTFDPDVTNSEEYVWHRDKNDRFITVLEGEGWMFQFDDELPKNINITEMLFIPKMMYHRLIKGKTELRIKIHEKV